MLKNKKKLRRLERKTPGYAVKTAQSLVLAGALVLGGAGVASAALTAGDNWGDQVVTGPAATGNGDSLWRDGKILPGTPNNGDITLNGGTFTVGSGGTGTTGTTVGNGNVHVTSGGIDVNGGNLWINQGKLTLAGGTTLTIASGQTLQVASAITAQGALTSTLAGIMQAEIINFGTNALETSGTVRAFESLTAGTVKTTGAGVINVTGGPFDTATLTANKLDLNSSGAFTADKVIATGADSVINTSAGTILLGDANFGDKALHVKATGANAAVIKNLTVGALTLGNAGAGAGAGVSKVTVNGNMNAGTVVINAAAVTDGVLTLGANPSDKTVSMQGEHSTAGVTITQGTLALAGRAEVKDADGEITIGAVGQTLTGNVALNAALGSLANSVLSTSAGTHTIDGDVTVASTKGGTITAAAGTLNVNNITLNGVTGNTSALVLDGAGTVNVTDTFKLAFGTATLTNGTLKVAAQDKLVMDADSKLTVTSGTLHVSGDYNHTMGAQLAGLVMDGGTLRSDGKLTLTANDAGITQAINTGAANGNDTLKGNIVANTLHTNSSNDQGVTITAGSVQIMGKGVATGTDIYTTAVSTNNHSITVTNGSGSLVLGATSAANQGEGAYGGKVNTIVLSDPASKLQFGHGNFEVTTLVANANGALIFNDDTGFGGTNNLTLNTTSVPAAAFVAKDVTLGEGNFKVNGTFGMELASGGEAKIVLTAGNTSSLDKLTLGNAGNGLTSAANAGNYVINTLVLGNNASVVNLSGSGKVTTTMLDGGTSTVVAANLKVGGTGIWEIGDISNGANLAGFTLDGGNSTLLIGKGITVSNKSGDTTQFTIGSISKNYEVLGAGTFGTTGELKLSGEGSSYAIGNAATTAAGIIQNLQAQKLTFSSDNTTDLTLGGGSTTGTLTLTGDGTDNAGSITNAKSIAVGSASNHGSLVLGAASDTAGGTYNRVITVGTASNNGTLQFMGGNFTLGDVALINNAGVGIASVDLVSGSGILDIKMNGAAVSGLELAGNTAAKNALNVGTGTVAGVHTDYEIVGGVTVTKGTVTFGNANANSASNVNILNNDIKLNGTTVADSSIKIDGGINLVSSITVADTKTGQININRGTLAVDSNLVLNKAAIYAANDAAGATLVVNGDLTTGTVTYGAALSTVGSMVINNTAAHNMTIAANKWTVQDNAGAASSITVNAGSATTNLNLEIGSGGIAASAFNITRGTVNLLGTGGAIALSGASAMIDVDADGTLNVGALATKDDAAVSPNWSAGNLKLSGGDLNVINGQLKVANLVTTAAGTDIILGDGKDKFNPEGTYGNLIVGTSTFAAGNNNLTVNRGAVQFGGDALPTDLSASMTRNNARAALVVNRAVDLSEVTATFGSSLQRNVRTANDKSIEFGEKSLTYINFDNTGKAADDFAITTAGNVFVDTGASLQVSKAGGLKNGDTVYLLESKGAAGSIKGMWNADRVNTQSRLLSLNLHTNDNRTQILGTTSMADINQTMPGISGGMAGLLVNMVNTVGEDPHSSNAGIRFASRVINRDFLASDAQAAPTIEGAAQMGAVAGVQVSTIGAASVASGAATTRTSFAQPLMDMTKAVAVHQDNDGTLSLDTGLNAGNGMKNGLGVWIMPLYQSNKTWGQKAENFKSGMSSDLGGIALGADYTINDMFRFGAAFNVGGGYGKSSGDFNETENRFNFWGVNLYGGWTMNNFGLSADVGYTSSFNAVEQDLPTSMEMGNLKADVTTSAWTAGLKGEYKFETSVVDIIPHVGVRYMGLTTDSYDVKSGGTVFGVERDFQSIWTFPIGVAFSKTITSDSGWMFKPMVDLTVIPAAGDLDAKSKVSIPGVGGNAEMKMQVVDAITYDGGVGFEVGKDNLSFGLNYNIQASEHRTGHGVFGTLRYEF